MPSPEIEKVYAHLRDIKARAREHAVAGDLEGFRKVIDDFGAVAPSAVEYSGKIVETDVEGLRCEWVTMEESDPSRRLLYIHGGSWMAGNPKSYRPLTSRIAKRTGCIVLAIDYRLAPEHKFPAGLNDCVAAFKWMTAYGPDGPSEASDTFIAGDSAGGNLTIVTLLSLRDAGDALPNAAVAISPATDFTGSGESRLSRADVDPIIDPANLESVARSYFGGGDPMNPLVSPLFADLAGLPPLLVQVGDAETLLDDGVRFVDKARDAGVDATLEVWPEMPHVWHAFAPYLPEATQAVDDMCEFLLSKIRSRTRG